LREEKLFANFEIVLVEHHEYEQREQQTTEKHSAQLRRNTLADKNGSSLESISRRNLRHWLPLRQPRISRHSFRSRKVNINPRSMASDIAVSGGSENEQR